ncbi:thioesterase family protein [Hyphomonas polymorpha PS728]|uniref:Thioesterase family protein n=1 Tax=Hyphomonas polymorpha PS728 TaxID=1280954 RepID=A0A062V8L7_9PROT|nr:MULTISPECIES: YbgC/FadM family acyl-CoA thioesterase [Hyphomonas]AXE65809.1 Tol-Pal system-associated acyl-CoA thioesterase [Hyphomonas sp. CACIAM 19H1]KCZ98521.1 thioesterase family protein [Hyphomonas polymorpha PS728]
MTLPVLDAQNFDAARQHWIAVRVYYEDTDFTGMVYHANYLRFFERGRSDHLRDAGISHQSLLAREDPAAFTLTNVSVTYRKPAKVDDLLHIRTRYLGMDGPRIRFSQTCLRGDEVLAEGEITAVMIHADGRLRRPIREISEHLEAYRWQG